MRSVLPVIALLAGWWPLVAAGGRTDGWTFFFYISADTFTSDSLVERLERVRSDIAEVYARNESASFVVLFDPRGGERPAVLDAFVAGRRSKARTVGDRGEPNLGDARTLENEFLKPGLAATRTTKNALVILGHGNGWQPPRPRASGGRAERLPLRSRGCLAADASHGDDGLSLFELQDALRSVGGLLRAGKFDLVVLHACSMGAVEAGFQLRDVARFLVACSGPLGKTGLCYRCLATLAPETDARTLGLAIATDSQAAATKAGDLAPVICVCNLGRVGPLAEAVSQLASTISLSRSSSSDLAEDVLDWRQPLADRPLDTDLGAFCQCVAQSPWASAETKSAARRVLQALRGVDSPRLGYIAASTARPLLSRTFQESGVSVFSPPENMLKKLNGKDDNALGDLLDYYAQTDFARSSTWLALLRRMTEARVPVGNHTEGG